MLVQNWMNMPVITIDADASFHKALILLKENNIRMLPVTQKSKLIGIITDRDVKRASASDATSLDIYELSYLIDKIKVKSIMTPNPVWVPLNYTIEETAKLLLKHKISGVPVVDPKGNIIGTITQSDIFRVIISLTGVGKKGIQFAFKIEDRPGSIKDIADIIRKYEGRIVRILTCYDNASEGFCNVYIRIYSLDRERLRQMKNELKRNATILYMVDHRDNRREVY